MAQNYPDEPERDDGHDDERLGVGAQRDRQQREDQDHGDPEPGAQRVHGFQLLLLFTSEGVGQFRVLGDKPRKDVVFQDPGGPPAGDDRRIHVGGDPDDALALLAMDGRRRPARAQGGHPAHRDLRAGRGPHEGVLDVGDRVALLLGQPHVHANLFRAPLHAQGFRAEERGPRLSGQVVEGEPQRSRLGQEAELDLRDAGGVIGANVVDAPDLAEATHHRSRDVGEALRVRMRQHRLDGVAEVVDLAADGDRARMGQDAHLLAPRLRDISRGNAPVLRVQELERDGGDIGFRVQVGIGTESAALDPRPFTDGDRDSRKEGKRIGGPIFGDAFDGAVAGRLQLPRHLVGALGGGPVRHLERGGREIALHLGGQGERDDAGRQHGRAQDEQGDRSRERQSGPVGGEGDPVMQRALHEPPQQQVDPGLNPGHALLQARPG